jgi:hypothetical protein
MNFEKPPVPENIKKESVVLERDWEDENLPESFEVTVCETVLDSIQDEVVIFKEVNQGIGAHKIPGRVQIGDRFKIYMADPLDQGVPTDGIIKIKNISTGETSNTETWRE